MAEIIWTETALKNLRDITNYVAEDSPLKADKLTIRLSEAPNLLEHTPRIGRRVPEFFQDNIRELVTVRPYRLIYVIRDDSCYITAIVHSRRDLKKALRAMGLQDFS
jgi:plasmid stabilization system protein ParE